MKFTARTKEALRCGRIRRDLLARGFEEVTDSGGKMWEMDRGARMHHRIVDVVIAPECKTIFIRTEPKGVAGIPPSVGQFRYSVSAAAEAAGLFEAQRKASSA